MERQGQGRGQEHGLEHDKHDQDDHVVAKKSRTAEDDETRANEKERESEVHRDGPSAIVEDGANANAKAKANANANDRQDTHADTDTETMEVQGDGIDAKLSIDKDVVNNNIMKSPGSMKLRRIRTTNPNWKARAGKYIGTSRVMTTMGFTHSADSTSTSTSATDGSGDGAWVMHAVDGATLYMARETLQLWKDEVETV